MTRGGWPHTGVRLGGARGFGFLAAGLLAAAVVGGCTDKAQSGTFPTPTDSQSSTSPASSSPTSPSSDPTTSATRTPTPPPMPAAARHKSQAGAKAFIHYYFQLFNYANAHEDWHYFKSLSEPGCKGCLSITVPQPGHFKTGGKWIASGTQFWPGNSSDVIKLTIIMTGRPGLWIPSPHAQPTPVKKEHWAMNSTVVWRHGAWSVRRLVLVR